MFASCLKNFRTDLSKYLKMLTPGQFYCYALMMITGVIIRLQYVICIVCFGRDIHHKAFQQFRFSCTKVGWILSINFHVFRFRRKSGPGPFEKSVEVYDESADTWEVCFQMKASAFNSCVVAL